MNITDFIYSLQEIRLRNVFNPYCDVCSIHDTDKSPVIRRENLRAYLKAIEKSRPRTIWIGRDLGYRGGRRTGLALTDEFHLPLMNRLYANGASAIKKATKTDMVKERTAAIIWSVIEKIKNPPMLWNAFPFHPFDSESDMTNRCHTNGERIACAGILEGLLYWLQPETIVALGKDAHEALGALGKKAVYVRHPSYGGQGDFLKGMSLLYGVPISDLKSQAGSGNSSSINVAASAFFHF